MITITITISQILATILIALVLFILFALGWIIYLLISICEDCLNLNCIDSSLDDIIKKFNDSELKK